MVHFIKNVRYIPEGAAVPTTPQSLTSAQVWDNFPSYNVMYFYYIKIIM